VPNRACKVDEERAKVDILGVRGKILLNIPEFGVKDEYIKVRYIK
jgi:hypothetical protein